MKNLLLLIYLLIISVSCTEVEQEKTEFIQDIKAMDSKDSEESIKEAEVMPQPIIDFNIQGWIKIQFKGLTMAIEEIEVDWDDKYSAGNDSIYKPKTDTAHIYLFPGEEVDDLKFKILSSEYDKIEVFEKTIYHVTMNSMRDREVPMYVMSNWKSFESKWSRVKIDQKNPMFKTNERNIKPEINFTNEEFLNAVKKYCGIDWFDEIKTITSVEEMPSDIFLSYHLFKVIVRNSETGKAKEKFIAFYTATSC